MRRLALILAAASSLAACATAQKLGAANDVHALLVSIRDNDQTGFDAHVDRAALKQELQAKIEEQGAKRYGSLAALLAPSLAQFAGDALVQPSVFRQVARQYGYGDDTKIPNPILIAQALKPLPDGRVCATKKKNGPCTLVFTKEQGVWKLTGFEGDVKDLKLKL
jgi:predicted small secreted protein